MQDKDNLITFYERFRDEQVCRDYLEEMRWPEEITCPKCGVIGKAYKYSDGKTFKCAACRKQFTVRVGMIFEDSKLPLQKWFLAIYLASFLRKGISSIQLSKYLGITQKTAWFMLYRIRYAVDSGSYDRLLDDDAEMDETYVGGRHPMKQKMDNKTSVLGTVERQGRIYAQVTTDAPALQPYKKPSVSVFLRIHGQTASGTPTTTEGFWSHLKRGIDNRVGPKYLQWYCDEYQCQYNTHEMIDSERFTDWFLRIKHNTISCSIRS